MKRFINWLFRKMGYVPVQDKPMVIEKNDFKLERICIDYTIPARELAVANVPYFYIAQLHEDKIKELFKCVAPFIERKKFNDRTIDGEKFQLILWVGKPSS